MSNEPESDQAGEGDAFSRRLNQLLGERHAAPPALRARILSSVPPPNPLQQFLDWLLPVASAFLLWRPIAAAIMSLALGFSFGLGVDVQQQNAFYDQVLTYAFLEDLEIPLTDQAHGELLNE